MTISVPVLGHSTKIRRKTDQKGRKVKTDNRKEQQKIKTNITTENTKAQ